MCESWLRKSRYFRICNIHWYMLNSMLQALRQFLFTRSLTRLAEKSDAFASFAFSVASGRGHRKTKLCEGLDLGRRSHALPGSCVSSSLPPAFLVLAREVTGRWTELEVGWSMTRFRVPVTDEWAADRVNGDYKVATQTSGWVICTSSLQEQVGVPGKAGEILFGGGNFFFF